MTVTYLDIIPTAGWGNILQIFSIWRASLFKGVWKKLFLYCLLYTLISITYRLIISEEEQAKQTFERFCVFCNDYQVFLPLEFILGFYITQVVIVIVKYLLSSSLKYCPCQDMRNYWCQLQVIGRWWLQFDAIVWPDKLALDLGAFLPGEGRPKQVNCMVWVTVSTCFVRLGDKSFDWPTCLW